jgi:hypothetical protein
MPAPELRLDTAAASRYLLEIHGIRQSAKTLTNRRALGTGPRWRFWGSRPYVTAAALDEWVELMLSDEAANRRQFHKKNQLSQTLRPGE